MRRSPRLFFLAASLSAIALAIPTAANAQGTAPAARAVADDPFAVFIPTREPIRHRIDYEIYDFALKNIVISMGPSTRSRPYAETGPTNTRIRQGHMVSVIGTIYRYLFIYMCLPQAQ